MKYIPCLHDVAFGIVDVQRAVATVVLERTLDADPLRTQAPGDLVEGLGCHVQCEVDMRATLISELYLAGLPQPSSRS